MGGVQHAVAVDPDGAGLDLRDQPMHARQVVRPDARPQAEGRVVGQFGHLVEIVVGHGDQHRPEDLLARHARTAVHVDQHRGLHEVTLLPRALAARDDTRALPHADLDVVANALDLLARYQRVDLRRGVESMAQRHGIGNARDFLHHTVELLLVNVQARAGAAHSGVCAVETPGCRDASFAATLRHLAEQPLRAGWSTSICSSASNRAPSLKTDAGGDQHAVHDPVALDGHPDAIAQVRRGAAAPSTAPTSHGAEQC
jgi:hypothetical protein